GFNTGWQKRGTWIVPAGPPTAVSVTPAAGSGTSQLFQLTYSDGSGFGSITTARAIIHTGPSFPAACAVMYTASTQTLQVINDNGLGWGVGAKVGLPGTLQNSQCSIDLGASSVSGIGNNLTLNLATSFSPKFVGAKSLFMYADNKFG